jgi:hypothetical protein
VRKEIRELRKDIRHASKDNADRVGRHINGAATAAIGGGLYAWV